MVSQKDNTPRMNYGGGRYLNGRAGRFRVLGGRLSVVGGLEHLKVEGFVGYRSNSTRQ